MKADRLQARMLKERDQEDLLSKKLETEAAAYTSTRPCLRLYAVNAPLRMSAAYTSDHPAQFELMVTQDLKNLHLTTKDKFSHLTVSKL